MKALTLRFSEVMHELVAKESAQDGISMAQFCREAAIARVFFQAGKRGEVKEVDRIELMRQAFEEMGVDPDHGLDVVCELFRSLTSGHAEEPANGRA